jgi:hypothetical protein
MVNDIRFEAFTATKINKILPGFQPQTEDEDGDGPRNVGCIYF